MSERINVSRNAFIVAGIAAILTFLALVWVARVGDQDRTRERDPASPEKRVALTAPKPPPTVAQFTPGSLARFDHWVPPPVEFVRLIAPVSLHNSRGKTVKEFPVGKRLRVSKRAGDKVTINYLGDDYTIATASTEPAH